MTHNFALIGAAGYIAPRHLQAIRETGHRLVAAADVHDSVGVLDRHFTEVKYFREIERFDRHLEKLRRGPAQGRVDWVSICTPNYLHDAHIRLALRSGADAICEKPLVINPWNLDQLAEIERETGRRVFTVLQLRLHPDLVALKARIDREVAAGRDPYQVELRYVTGRGPWYDHSWKGASERSGGVAMNIGVHFFDLLLWLFGGVRDVAVTRGEPRAMAGRLTLAHAEVDWTLSVDFADLPFAPEPGRRTTYRSIRIDGEELEFSESFDGLHTRVYEETLAGRGFGLEDARASIDLVYRIRREVVAG